MISVVIPLYNKEKSIGNTIVSVLKQTYENFELLIVNDGSTDRSLEVVCAIDDTRIRVIDKPNGGVSSARNVGLEIASGEYVAFLDGDDIWCSRHLEIIANAIQEYDSEIVGGFATSFYKSSNNYFEEEKFLYGSTILVDNYFDFMASPETKFNSSTIVVKKDKALSVGGFDERLSYGEDVEFWYKLFSKYQLVYDDTVTTVYYTGAENRSVRKSFNLDRRFYKFDYTLKTRSEKQYLDKLVAIILIDCLLYRANKEAWQICSMYTKRLPGVFWYFVRLLVNKVVYASS